MSSKAEMSSGLVSGVHQGYKTGFGFSKMESGFKKGFVNGIRKHDKVQDPIALIGSKEPAVFWLADYCETGTAAPFWYGDPVPNSNVSLLYNLAGSYVYPDTAGSPAITTNSSPSYRYPGVINGKAYIDFNSSLDTVYSSSTNNKSEMTVVMVVRLSNSIDNQYLFSRVSTTISNTIGDVRIYSMGGNRVRVEMYGNPTTTLSVYETYAPDLQGVVEGRGWCILTVKCRLSQPYGQGSEMEIYVNGCLNMTPITTTFTGSTSNFANGTNLLFGNGPVASSLTGISSGGGSNIASGMVLDYWLNSSEQIRIENFYRYYYGYRF